MTVADLQDFERRRGPDPARRRDHPVDRLGGRGGAPRPTPTLDARRRAATSPGSPPPAARWLIEHRRLDERGALGTDTFGPDLGADPSYPVSTLLYDRRRISLENLTNLAALPETGGHVLVGSPINRAGSGSPATVYGIIPNRPAPSAGRSARRSPAAR